MHGERSYFFPVDTHARGLLRRLFTTERFIESENTIVTVKTFGWCGSNGRTSACKAALLFYGYLDFSPSKPGIIEPVTISDRSMSLPGHSRVFHDLSSRRGNSDYASTVSRSRWPSLSRRSSVQNLLFLGLEKFRRDNVGNRRGIFVRVRSRNF